MRLFDLPSQGKQYDSISNHKHVAFALAAKSEGPRENFN